MSDRNSLTHTKIPEARGETVSLFGETLDAFGSLLAAHIELARIELVVGMKAQGRRVATLAVLIGLSLFGYATVWLALALVFSRWLGLTGALFLLGGLHLLGAMAAVFVVLRKIQGMGWMPDTASDVDKSLTLLIGRKSPETAHASTTASKTATPSKPAILCDSTMGAVMPALRGETKGGKPTWTQKP